MSLALLQGYSSPEEDEGEGERLSSSSLGDGDDGDEEDEADVEDGTSRKNRSRKEKKKPVSSTPRPTSNSLLPSALDAFAEVPPFLALIFLCLDRFRGGIGPMVSLFLWFSLGFGGHRAAGVS